MPTLMQCKARPVRKQRRYIASYEYCYLAGNGDAFPKSQDWSSARLYSEEAQPSRSIYRGAGRKRKSLATLKTENIRSICRDQIQETMSSFQCREKHRSSWSLSLPSSSSPDTSRTNALLRRNAESQEHGCLARCMLKTRQDLPVTRSDHALD